MYLDVARELVVFTLRFMKKFPKSATFYLSISIMESAKNIYKYCATLKNKGMWFCLKRLKKRYNNFMHKYGNTGYILILDFYNYFYSIDHNILYGMIKRFMDDDCFKFYCDIIDNMKGLNLGSQLSRISAVFFAHRFDEVCQKHTIYYVRYMDDSYCMFKCKEDLLNALDDIMSVVKSLGLEINPKKIKIIKASSGFTFLKKRLDMMRK